MTHVVARIGKPHGVQGEVTVRLHTDEPRRRFVPGARFEAQPAPPVGAPSTLTLRSARLHNRVWLLGFEQVDDRDAAERLRGTHLLVPQEPSREVSRPGHEGQPDDQAEKGTDDGRDDEAEDGWYEEELLGLAVERVDGTPVGTVSGLRVGSAQDLLEVALLAGGTAYVPFVVALVPVVDLRGRRVVVDPPAGLLELDA